MPQHVAIIMDGNGRWAADRSLPRLLGHRKGADVVRDITTFARKVGLRYLTLYSFSCQNWYRPQDEVSGLMTLLEDYCLRERATLLEHGIQLRIIGESGRLPPSTQQALAALQQETARHDAMTLCLAVDYGGREEIVGAVRRLLEDVLTNKIELGDVDATAISQRLCTHAIPDPDLLIRTSGEQRLSNFLLWQLAYSELYFTAARWPEFSVHDFVEALWAYARRERRFGAIGPEQLRSEAQRSERHANCLQQEVSMLFASKGTGTC